uniref:Uncharacterized protein n=1 Tax=Erythrolobus madagascarensis TaxID=708628 RepID=A0A7S0T401_9RHOD
MQRPSENHNKLQQIGKFSFPSQHHLGSFEIGSAHDFLYAFNATDQDHQLPVANESHLQHSLALSLVSSPIDQGVTAPARLHSVRAEFVSYCGARCVLVSRSAPRRRVARV